MFLPMFQQRERRRYHRKETFKHIIFENTAIMAALVAVGTLLIWIVEPIGFWDALWFMRVTMTTVGYGDIYPVTAIGREIAWWIGMVGGIGAFANFATCAYEYWSLIREQKEHGYYRWPIMNQRILIVNIHSTGAKRYLRRFAKEIRKDPEYVNHEIMILTDQFEDGKLPISLRDLGLFHTTGTAHDVAMLEKCEAAKCDKIIILSPEPTDSGGDTMTVGIVDMLRKRMGVKATIIAEVADDDNRQWLKDTGANQVVRASNDYAETMVKSVVCPGFEVILEDLTRIDGNESNNFHVNIVNKPWAEIVCAMAELGCLLMGWITPQGEVHKHGSRDDNIVNASQLFLNFPPDARPTAQQLEKVLS